MEDMTPCQLAFEKWARTKELWLSCNPITNEFYYAYIDTQMFWECWQAAFQVALYATTLEVR
jgi:hypothetical protein